MVSSDVAGDMIDSESGDEIIDSLQWMVSMTQGDWVNYQQSAEETAGHNEFRQENFFLAFQWVSCNKLSSK